MNEEERRLLERHTSLILNADFAGMVPAGRKQATQKAIREIREQYEQAAAKRDAKETEEKDRKYYAGVCESIAKGLPNLSKGVLSAVSAFTSGNDIAGAAAIMDICSKLAQILGSLSAAGGPPGMLVGALFSVVSQLLAFFGPKQPSLTDQIKDIVDRAASEEKLATMRAVADGIDIYDATIRGQCAKIEGLLASSLDPKKIDESIWSDIGALRHGLSDDQRALDVSNFATWQALEWLGLEGKAELDYWPEILGVCCQACIKLIGANTALACAVDRAQLGQVLAFHQDSNLANTASPELKKKMRDGWLKMDAAIREIYSQWLPRYEVLARILDKLTPLARDRGLFCHLGGGNLYACTGPKAIASGNWTYLTNRYLSSLGVALTQADMGRPNPKYHCVLQQPAYSLYAHRTWHYMLSSNAPPSVEGEQHLPTWYNEPSGPHGSAGIADLCAIAGTGPERSKEIVIYVAGDKRISALEYNEQHKLENRGWRSPTAKAEVVLVRAAHPKPVIGDKAAELLGAGRISGQILYGALKDSGDVFVCTSGDPDHGYLSTPWARYKGIAADERFLWVFGTGGFACVTHAAVLAHLEKKLPLRWIEHYPNTLLYVGLDKYPSTLIPQSPEEPELKGMVDMSACTDGSLYVSATTRRREAGRYVDDDGGIHVASYQVDLESNTIEVDAWRRFGGGYAEKVLKLPIYCWPALESLQTDLALRAV